MERAAAALAASGACDLLTVHAEPQVLAAAVRGRAGADDTRILGVTVMTSLSPDDLRAIGYEMALEALVERRIRQTIDAGAHGVIVSPHEAALARRLGGPDFLVVTPGVRPAGASLDDQARAATPGQALRNGASHIVVARPVVASPEPQRAARAIVEEMAGAPAPA